MKEQELFLDEKVRCEGSPGLLVRYNRVYTKLSRHRTTGLENVYLWMEDNYYRWEYKGTSIWFLS